ncbi:hypothetical protein [Bacillus sp. B1-b2]|uniref:hypothetical protein n=1 Tax=Bacillus sp. B1-b2 TaxID=2653201 RepID=UPI001262660F|nr:hypothetical protein [Bacillus sp. B1-b2]KAB7667351.1 hypothetical protein F9279_15920 [Bacillus sp. B1-b2]
MIKSNEKGNALITVLLISLVFTTIGLAIVASTISGTKRVETRESDINVTYQSKKVLDEITSNMANLLDQVPLDYVKQGTKYQVKTTFEDDLKSLVITPTLTDILDNEDYRESIQCLSVVDISNKASNPTVYDSTRGCAESTYSTNTPYTINKQLDFTRVLEVILVTNNPNETEGAVTRTLKQRIILSPLPSFLKYAVGSYSEEQEEGLFLNGSSNINGNIYANQLTISDRANYQLRDGTKQTVRSLPPSITGNIYSTSANLLPVLIADNFYKSDIPSLYHDSQFINIEYDQTIIQRINTMLDSNPTVSGFQVTNMEDVSNFTNKFKNKLTSIVSSSVTKADTVKSVTTQEAPTSVNGNAIEQLTNSFKIESDKEALSFNNPVYINGDTVINSSNYAISFNKELVVDGDLYLVSNNNLTLQDNIYVSGDIHLVNFDGEMNITGDIIAAGDMNIESSADNAGQLSKGVTLKGDILTGKSINIRPLNTTISLNSNMISLGSFTINGDETGENSGENDIVRINSVVYSLEDTFVSNTNILGLTYTNSSTNKQETGQLILLAKENLTITRMNEFNHFDPKTESGFPYLPEEEEIIQPLQAFFYTEKNAELYGVGSLFYIKGGIFAKNSLEINAIRANRDFSKIEDVPGSGDGMLSRFIVDYDQNVLFKGIDALPLVDRLQIIPDDFVIE